MKAMILAAGRGKRMVHLTNELPKPLLKVEGKSLIEYQVERLVQAGFKEIVINVSYMADKIVRAVGFGDKWGIKICYSHEISGGLETGGGIRQALPLLSDPFLVVNADVWTNYDLSSFFLLDMSKRLAHLVLVNNPEHNLKGDYSIGRDSSILPDKNGEHYTFAGISCFQKSLFKPYSVGDYFSTPSAMQAPILDGEVTAELHHCEWQDIGTPSRLARVCNR
jgi:MurNAc alpha-1-phosphate uridylyltransferase